MSDELKKVLAWDTSSKSGALVAMEWGSSSSQPQLIAELTLNVDSTHSERLLWGIHQILEAARWKLSDVDLFGVGVGPGSFTGLRIGITTARTLAHTLKKPLIAVSSLAALARPVSMEFSRSHPQTWVIAITDACKGEVFSLYGSAGDLSSCVLAPLEVEGSEAGLSLWKEGVSEAVIPPGQLVDQILQKLKQSPRGTQWVMVGGGRERYSEYWKDLPQDRQAADLPRWYDCIQGRYLGLLVFEADRAGHSQNGLDISPRYLRVSEAERKLRAGLLTSPSVK